MCPLKSHRIVIKYCGNPIFHFIDTRVKDPSSLFKKYDHFQATAGNCIIFRFQIVLCHGLKYLAALLLCPSNMEILVYTAVFTTL